MQTDLSLRFLAAIMPVQYKWLGCHAPGMSSTQDLSENTSLIDSHIHTNKTTDNISQHHVFLRIRQCLEHLCLRQQQQQQLQQWQHHEGLGKQQQWQQYQVLGRLLLRQPVGVILWHGQLRVQQRLGRVHWHQWQQLCVVEVYKQD